MIVQTTAFHSAKAQKCIPLDAVGAGSTKSFFSFFLAQHLTLGIWNYACTHLANLGKSVWLGTLCSSGHHASVYTWWACQRTQQLLSSRDGSGISSWSGSSLHSLLGRDGSSPLRNSWTWGSNMDKHPKSSALGCDQSVWWPCTISSAQDSGWESLASMLRLPSKVIHHLEDNGLGDWIFLLAWCEDTRDSLLHWSAALDLLWKWA